LDQITIVMSGGAHLSTWVSKETKARFGALAHHQSLSESALLKRTVELMVQVSTGQVAALPVDERKLHRRARLYVRLRPEDHVALRERAAGRGMATATYVSMLLRAHVRAIPPLPDRELAELKRTVAGLGMIGRNLNQIARVANQTGRVIGPSAVDLRGILSACEALRDHVKDLIKANAASWETGHAEADG
jgi:Bacterial mobilisation protein (MobC)